MRIAYLLFLLIILSFSCNNQDSAAKNIVKFQENETGTKTAKVVDLEKTELIRYVNQLINLVDAKLGEIKRESLTDDQGVERIEDLKANKKILKTEKDKIKNVAIEDWADFELKSRNKLNNLKENLEENF